jgi:uncharacterized protein
MIERTIKNELLHSLEMFPAVALVGSRQSGKTTLAKMLQAHFPKVLYLDLELPSDYAKLDHAELFLKHYEDHLIIIDEIQTRGELFPLLRALIDQNRKAGRFLILGSSSPALIRNSAESLAGRIIYHELYPFNIFETGETNIQKLWVWGAYPGSFLAPTLADSHAWRDAFLRSLAELDLPAHGINASPIQINRLLTMIAHSQGQLLNSSALAKNFSLSLPTIQKMLDIFEGAYLIRRLLPYHSNLKKRLIKTPKLYLRDSGLCHRLLNIFEFDDLLAHPVLGHSWEAFIIEQLASILPRGWEISFYRTAGGAEIDILLTGARGQKIAAEIKYSATPKVSKGFYSALEDLQITSGYVIYPGNDSYPLREKITALPASSLHEMIQ